MVFQSLAREVMLNFRLFCNANWHVMCGGGLIPVMGYVIGRDDSVVIVEIDVSDAIDYIIHIRMHVYTVAFMKRRPFKAVRVFTGL